MTDKDQITGQTAVGRSVPISKSNCTDASTQIPCMKYTNSLATEKNLWLKSGLDQPGHRLCPWGPQWNKNPRYACHMNVRWQVM